ncbi:MAG: hypothetical protein GY799_12660 [Desulfobulbaceae bacterium]|nr:hypothetical protein [Desulfobulbaceae bacterium]
MERHVGSVTSTAVDTLLDYGWKWVAQQGKNNPTYRVKRIGEGKGDMNHVR